MAASTLLVAMIVVSLLIGVTSSGGCDIVNVVLVVVGGGCWCRSLRGDWSLEGAKSVRVLVVVKVKERRKPRMEIRQARKLIEGEIVSVFVYLFRTRLLDNGIGKEQFV